MLKETRMVWVSCNAQQGVSGIGWEYNRDLGQWFGNTRELARESVTGDSAHPSEEVRDAH